jgi:zinc D-Ala-D-Ala carboxypeptidase
MIPASTITAWQWGRALRRGSLVFVLAVLVQLAAASAADPARAQEALPSLPPTPCELLGTCPPPPASSPAPTSSPVPASPVPASPGPSTTPLPSPSATPRPKPVGPLPRCSYSDVLTALRGYHDWPLTLLDPIFRVARVYAPPDLVSASRAGLSSRFSVRAVVVDDLRAMVAAARRAGAPLAIQSAYRSYWTQASAFSYWTGRLGRSTALLVSARPGHSEHQLGTTIDFTSQGSGAPWFYADWGRTKAGRWMALNAWRYGFVMSYPRGATATTCYRYEPWHYRYVGIKAAREIHARGDTLREWLWTEGGG